METGAVDVSMQDAIRIKDKIIYFDMRSKNLCSIDINTYELDVMGTYPDEQFMAKKIVMYKDRLYVFSQWGLQVVVFDLQGNLIESNKFESVLPTENMVAYVQSGNYMLIFSVAKKVNQSGEIIIYQLDLDRNVFSEREIKGCGEIIKCDVLYGGYPTFADNKLFVADGKNGLFVEIDISKCVYRLIPYKRIDKYKYGAGVRANEKNYFTNVNEASVFIDSKEKNNVINMSHKTIKQPFSHICKLGKHLVVLPRYSDCAVLINTDDDSYEKFAVPEGVNNGSSKSVSLIDLGGRVWVLPLGMLNILEINMSSFHSKFIQVWAKNENLVKQKYYSEWSMIIQEGDFNDGLSELILRLKYQRLTHKGYR